MRHPGSESNSSISSRMPSPRYETVTRPRHRHFSRPHGRRTTRGKGLQIEQLRGLVALAEGKEELGLLALRDAAKIAESQPFGFGPPGVVKPAFELLGEELLRLGNTQEAETAFRVAVSRTPGRVLSVRGLEQAGGVTF